MFIVFQCGCTCIYQKQGMLSYFPYAHFTKEMLPEAKGI